MTNRLMKIALLPGHAAAAGGAEVCAGSHKGESEYRLASRYGPQLAQELTRLGYEVVQTGRESAGGTTPSYSAKAANATGADIAIECHFNAAGPTATGCCVMHWGKSEQGRRFAAGLSADIAEMLEVRDRGPLAVPTPEDRGTEAFRRSVMPFFMIEPCFAGSNPDDARAFCALIDSGVWVVRLAYAIDTRLREVYTNLS